MAIRVSVVVAVAAEAYDRPVVETSYAVPVSAVSYISIVVDPQLDLSGRYKLIRDTFLVVDSAVIAFGKALADIATASDMRALSTTKVVSDTLTPTDAFARAVAYIRAFSETSSVSDTTTVSFVKAAYDSFTASDAITTMSFAKFLSDGVAMNDSFDATDGSQYAFTKGVSNVVFASDEATRTVDYVRGFSDATAFQTQIISTSSRVWRIIRPQAMPGVCAPKVIAISHTSPKITLATHEPSKE
jgi:hypothetical protein